MNKKRSFLILLVVVVWVMTVTAVSAADDQWRARYWNNTSMSGDPVVVRSESNLNHVWGEDAPVDGVNADNFSVRWTRTVNFSAGTYRFVATTDDGMRVYVDDTLLIDSWYDSQSHTVAANTYLSAGDHHLKVEYYEAGGGAVAQLSWSAASGTIYNWRGEYFNNATLTGQPALVRDDASVNFSWGANAPANGINADQFSARWTRDLPLQAGQYRFTVTADDGVRLWVNGVLLIDKWQDQATATYNAVISVAAGSVPVKLEYYENRDRATVQLNWVYLGTAETSGASGTPSPQSAGVWAAEYYNNINLDGVPAATRTDDALSFIWGSSSPIPNVVEPDNFAVRWTGNLNLTAGRYDFTAAVDGGVRVWVNGQLVIDQWKFNYDVKTYTGAINLPGGTVPVKVEYFDDAGLAEMRLSWIREGETTAPVSQDTTFPEGTLTAAMTGARALNVRSGPGLDFEALTYLTYGQTVALTGYRDYSGFWVEIRLSGGGTGWVSARYMSSSVDFTGLAVKAAQ